MIISVFRELIEWQKSLYNEQYINNINSLYKNKLDSKTSGYKQIKQNRSAIYLI